MTTISENAIPMLYVSEGGELLRREEAERLVEREELLTALRHYARFSVTAWILWQIRRLWR